MTLREWFRKAFSRAGMVWFGTGSLIGLCLGFIVHVVLPYTLRPALTDAHEVVMCKGMQIRARDASSEIVITALSPTRRRFAVEDVDMTLTMIPMQDRWSGKFGLYRPTGNFWVHASIGEAHRYLADAADMLYEIALELQNEMHVALSPDGLVVAWAVRRDPTHPGRKALVGDVVQYFLKGQRASIPAPEGVGTVEVSSVETCEARRAPRGYSASSEQLIGGRLYTGRALDLMKEWKISPASVEVVIRRGKQDEIDGGEKMFRGKAPFEESLLPEHVVVDKDGRVMSVAP